jgi:hypothetical protein
MTWTGHLVQAVGALMVCLVLADVFLTVLFPASGRGPLRKPLSRWTWRAFATVARRLGTQRRRRFLGYSGPTQVVLTVVVWIGLLALGWALVFLPELGHGVVAASGRTDTGLAAALYFSGFSLTTLGTGDIVPVTGLYRVLTVAEAALGFSVFTLVLTYFMSVYSAITNRRTFASSLHQRTYGTGESVQLLIGIIEDGGPGSSGDGLSQLGGFLTHTLETHRSYPVLRYFHFREQRYALPQMLLVALDAAALARSGLDADRYPGLLGSTALYQVSAAGVELLEELVPHANEEQPSLALERPWEQHFVQAVQRMRAAGLQVVPDPGPGTKEYAAQRCRWDSRLRALAHAMIYEWDEIERHG